VWLGAAARSCNNTIYEYTIYQPIHLYICSSVHSLPLCLYQLDYNQFVEINIHLYATQSPVRRAFHLILSFVSDPTTPDSAHPHHLSSTPPSPSIIKYIFTLEHIPRTPKRWETVSPTPLQNQKEKVKS
jgi:hypothetical protein